MNVDIAFPLTVGITGHRTLQEKQLPRITAQVDTVLQIIQKEAEETASMYTFPPLLRLISNLSEGADRLAAERAIKLGWNLQAVLPFPLHSPLHARDLDEDARCISRQHLARLCGMAETLIQLDRDIPHAWQFVTPPLHDPNSDHPLASAFRQDCYLQAATIVVEQCDILLCLWSGEPQAAVGSTFDTLVGISLKSSGCTRTHVVLPLIVPMPCKRPSIRKRQSMTYGSYSYCVY